MTVEPCVFVINSTDNNTSDSQSDCIKRHLLVQGTCMSDTLMQVLLTTQCLEEPVTEIILEKLVEVCNEERSSTSHSASRDEEIPLHEQPFPQLLLAQLQILDNGNCTEKIASLMIEAFESLPPPMKAQICTILGEVVPPEHIAGLTRNTTYDCCMFTPCLHMPHKRDATI